MPKVLRLVIFIGLLVTGCLSLWADAVTSDSGETIELLQVEGTIVPVVADYIDRGLSQAEAHGATVCIIQLSTPGGLYATTQHIVERIMNAEVPVVVYVSPASGWAGSAGTFITISAHIAAMAPATRIGAAHPVGVGTEMTEEMKGKVTEDAAAWIRSIAQMRGRDPDHAELAVRESKSYSDQEALEANLIDIRVENLPDLIAELDGRRVTLIGGKEVTLRTADAHVNRIKMGSIESLLHVISDPNIAYILLSLGSIGLIAELYNPGLIFPGVAGGISLLMAFYSLGVLNAYWGGIMLIFLAFGLFLTELFVTSGGMLTAGGVSALTIGSLILFSGSSWTTGVDIGLIIGMVVGITALFVFVIAAVIRAQRRQPVTGREGMVGQKGIARTDLDPAGAIFIEGERWPAIVEDDTIERGEEVIVTRIEGPKLIVTRIKTK